MLKHFQTLVIILMGASLGQLGVFIAKTDKPWHEVYCLIIFLGMIFFIFRVDKPEL